MKREHIDNHLGIFFELNSQFWRSVPRIFFMFDITSITSYPAANKQFTTYTGSLCLVNSNEVDSSSLETD